MKRSTKLAVASIIIMFVAFLFRSRINPDTQKYQVIVDPPKPFVNSYYNYNSSYDNEEINEEPHQEMIASSSAEFLLPKDLQN